MPRRHVNENLRTDFEGSGRLAGTGINEEDYSEESFPDRNPWRYKKHKPLKQKIEPAPIEPAPVVVYKLSEEALKKYRGEGG